MPLLRWLASVLRSSVWLVVNLAIAGGLFVASAALFASTQDDFRVPATIVRTVAAIWLYAALWTWLVRGVLMRPAQPAAKKKPSGAEVARTSAGCAGTLAAIAIAWVGAGGVADWAVAGITGPDPEHPARQLGDRGLTLLQGVAAQPDFYIPRIIGGLVALLVLTSVLSRIAAPRPTTDGQPAQAFGRRTNKKKGDAKPRTGASPSQIPTRAADAVAVAHDGAHSSPRPGAVREDAVLGPVRWSSSDGGWWARQSGDLFPVHIEASAEGPSLTQIDLARAVVQRAFEAQLRASDAARTAAQARGVGLPRFTIVTASVGADQGADTPVTLHLRCDGDAQHQYTVRSTNALHSFVVA